MENKLRTKTERAGELGRRIRVAMRRGMFKLGSGYLSQIGRARGKPKCEGCALAAAAFVLSNDAAKAKASRADCEVLVEIGKDGLSLTTDEADQLEMGYEGWDVIAGIKVNRRSPFYKLGDELAAKAGHIGARLELTRFANR